MKRQQVKLREAKLEFINLNLLLRFELNSSFY